VAWIVDSSGGSGKVFWSLQLPLLALEIWTRTWYDCTYQRTHICHFNGHFKYLKERKRIADRQRERERERERTVGTEPVSLVIKNGSLRWFGHVDRKDDVEWVNNTVWRQVIWGRPGETVSRI